MRPFAARLRLPARVVAGLVLGACLLGLTLALPAAAQPPVPAEPPHLVRITYPDKATLSLLDSQGWDIWEVHPDYAVAVPPPGLAVQSLPAGVTVTDLGAVPPASFDAGYHTYTSTLTAMRAVSDTHPGIVTLFDIGDGWEMLPGGGHHDLWAARVASHPGQGKPAVLFMAAIHAREIATPEVALALLSHLANGYGVDPLITYLVDQRETWIVPMVNPDGHIRAETGFWWRKNVDNTNGACNPGQYWTTPGVDLNRNFGYQWGGGGASTYACDETYRGREAFSEPEDQAMKALVEAHPFATVVSYHAYGGSVLYPWGFTATPPTDGGLMQAMAAKVASYAGYAPGQAIGLYATNGDTCDWTWGAHGIPCFTVEMGSQFMPPYSAVAGLWDENRPGALYVLNIADQPSRSFGPEATGLRAISWTTGVSLTARITNQANDGQVITGAEYFVDTVGANGSGLRMHPREGAWNAANLFVAADLPPLPTGPHTVYVRGVDSGGHWGSLAAAWPRQPDRWYLPLVARGGGLSPNP